ncbi:MAG: site-specific DNA-methyltransferase, partial [candidate division WOR-3 bacterium]
MKKERREIELFEKEAKLFWFGQDKTILDRLDKYILPFQTAESLAIDRPARGADLWHETYQKKESEWRNRLIWGDNLYVLASLLPEFRGKVDLIYIDPPFATGADFSLRVKVNGDELEKLPSAIEMKAYSDTWSGGIASYLQWLYERLVLMRELLSETGTIYVHLDWHVGHYVKVLMDEIFGRENFQREIVWDIRVLSGFKTQTDNWVRGHDVLLFYSKTNKFIFNKLTVPHRQEYLNRFDKVDEKGRKYFDGRGGKRYLDEVIEKGKAVGDVWDDIMSFQQIPTSSERVGFPTQKPEKLLDRIIKASSNPGDLVLDAFCGSGTTCAVAEKLGRRWIGIDIGRFAIHTTRKRLLQIEKEDPERG